MSRDAWLEGLVSDLGGRLATRRLGRDLRALHAVDSTMTTAAEWARAGAPDGALVIAATQTEGRGRLGRPWHDQPGSSLLCSVVIRHPGGAWPASLLPLAAGVAAAVAIDDAAGVQALLKWPNDVMVNGRKVAGILVEGHGGGVFVVGLGVNLVGDAVPVSLRGIASSLDAEAGRPVVAAAVLAGFLTELERLTEGMTGDAGVRVRASWEAMMLGRDEPVTVTPASGAEPPLEGIARGLAVDGALRLDTGAGETVVYAGDVTLKPGEPACAE